MSAIFILKKDPPKKKLKNLYLKDRYFAMGDLINMNVGVC